MQRQIFRNYEKFETWGVKRKYVYTVRRKRPIKIDLKTNYRIKFFSN